MIRLSTIWSFLGAFLLSTALTPTPSLASSHSKQKQKRIALLIGHNKGGYKLPLLRFAERDAQRLSTVLKDLGGVSKQDIFLLLGPSRSQVRQAMKKIRQKLLSTKGQAVFFFYYSGHALREHFRLGKQQMSFAEVMRFVRKLPVRIRIVMIDSCYSGQFLRAKGARRRSSIKWRPLASLRTRGMAILTSSEASGRSYESDMIQGSLFTSSLLAGLRGAADKNQDQRISLAELHTYVYQQTLTRSASELTEVQRPSHRLELRGQGDLFLTFLQKSSSRLFLSKNVAGHLFLYHKSNLLQDFEKNKGEVLRVGLKPGAYKLQIRHHGWVGNYLFRVGKAQQHNIRAERIDWRKLSLNEKRKGGRHASPPTGLGFHLHYKPLSNLSLNGLGAALSLDSGRLVRIAIGYQYSGSNVFQLPYQTHAFYLRTAVGYGFSKGPLEIWLGVHLDPAILMRSSEQGRLFNAGFSAGLLAHFDYHLHPGLALRLIASGGVELFFFEQNAVRTTATFDFGVGFVWRP